MTRTTDSAVGSGERQGGSPTPESAVEYVKVGELRPTEDVETCLRPLGLCELGGACDSCWYRPDHPRFRD